MCCFNLILHTFFFCNVEVFWRPIFHSSLILLIAPSKFNVFLKNINPSVDKDAHYFLILAFDYIHDETTYSTEQGFIIFWYLFAYAVRAPHYSELVRGKKCFQYNELGVLYSTVLRICIPTVQSNTTCLIPHQIS